MSRVTRLLALVLVTLLLVACDSSRRSPGPELLDEVDVAPKATIGVDESGFDVTTLETQLGDAFEVVNNGDEPHSFFIADPFIDTGDIFPGESTVVVLTTEGEFTATDGANTDVSVLITVTPLE